MQHPFCSPHDVCRTGSKATSVHRAAFIVQHRRRNSPCTHHAHSTQSAHPSPPKVSAARPAAAAVITAAASLMAARGYARTPARPLELGQSPWEAGCDGEDDCDDPASDEDPSGVFVSLVLDLLFAGKISARTVCLLCYWAHLAGASERVGRVGFAPGKPTGHYARHLDTVLQTRMNEDWYTINIPGVHKQDGNLRSLRKTPVALPYDAVIEEMQTSPGLLDTLRAKVASGDLPDAYYNHPSRGYHHECKDVPIGLFVDAVPTVKKDSCIGFFLYNVVSKKRFLCIALRKRCLCHCGCRGWCSYWACWNYLRWALTAFAAGVYPARKHDGTEWPPGAHADKAGQAMPWRGLLCQLKGDWAEWASSFGFCSHATTLFPCVACYCTHEDMHDLDDMEFQKLPWAPVRSNDYEAACAMCEISVVLRNRQEHAMVRGRLFYDEVAGRAWQVPGRIHRCSGAEAWRQMRTVDKLPRCRRWI